MAIKPVKRVLIANRGEIARRIIRTCSRLGVETVAVYTDPDAHAPFVREATQAVSLGPPDSYLSVEKIVAAAAQSGADAIHPGYGFLSENPALAEACERSKLILIGPGSSTMRTLGSKTSAKKVAEKANVPTAPTLIFSVDPLLPRAEQLTAFADRVGYPVMLKAAAGGGGRGMRVVSKAEEAKEQIESAEREALKAFGSSEVFAERFISPARHIEVQIAADQHGDVAALGTRDCSLQRSNQKIIEEGPATQLKEGVERAICEAACRLAKAAKYSNLGTVEFLYSPESGEFYFLEVNTRLQVEHPVTEMVTGLDLVELQLRLAEGKRLAELGVPNTPRAQGHAIEARLCAEEFSNGAFVLSTGVVQEFEIPLRGFDGAHVRVDAGVEPCSEVSHYYDSLIAKVIVHADTRAKAIDALRQVLSRSRISGVKTNRALLVHLLAHPTFSSLKHTVQGTKGLLPDGREQLQASVRAHALLAALRCTIGKSRWAKSSPWLGSSTRSLSPASAFPWATISSGAVVSSLSTPTESGASVIVSSGGAESSILVCIDDLATSHPDSMRLSARLANDSAPVSASVYRDGAQHWVHFRDSTVCLEERLISATGRAGTSSQTAKQISAHIPGKVAAVQVAVGDLVAAGQVLLVLDSMKMEHPIKAPEAGRIAELSVSAGAIVASGSLLLTVETA